MIETSLQPFGLTITAHRSASVTDLPHPLLEARLLKHKLVLLRGFESLSRDEFLTYCKSFPHKKTLDWSFGPVMEMKESADPKNYLFSREEVPFHWDGAFHRVPDYLVFSCVEAPLANAGGETLFTNTELILREAGLQDKRQWEKIELQYDTEKVAHYGGSVRAPLMQVHPRSNVPILRFAEPVSTKLNPVTMTAFGIDGTERDTFEAGMREKIYDPRFCYSHSWRQGDILIADNHSLIHGRTAFTKNCPRHLRRIQLMEA